MRAIMKYLLFKKGPLTSTGCDHGAFVSTNGAPTSLETCNFGPELNKLWGQCRSSPFCAGLEVGLLA